MTSDSYPQHQIQSRLLILATGFVILSALELTISPAVRARNFDVMYRWNHWLGVVVWGIGFLVIQRRVERYLPNCDPLLLPAAALISGWGLLTIWRLSPYYGLRQTIALGLVLVIFALGLRLHSNLSFLRRFKYLWLTGGLLLVAMTLILGTNPLGSGPRLWLGCCGIYFQPSELLKLLLVVYLSAYLADRLQSFYQGQNPNVPVSNNTEKTLQSLVTPSRGLISLLVPTFLMTGLALLLLLAQRDLGTASIFLFLYTAVVYLATGRKRLLLIMILALGLAALIGYGLFDVVRLRIDAWLNPWVDPSGRSYQIVQSLIAVANGGISGRGLGLGYPSLVPIAQSDFIFAAIAEEGGFPLVIGLLGLIGLIAQRGLRIALHGADSFHRYLAAGLTAYLVGQSILIIGGNLRLLPLTGVTLPFVSLGGSSLVTSFLSLLFLLHISQLSQEQQAILNHPHTRLYLHLGGLMLIALLAAGFMAGWWMVYRGPILVTRTDNPRRSIIARSVRRGALLDRSNAPIDETIGQAGSYLRQYNYPFLAPITGYDDPVYGQAGLEASMDEYLSGWRGNPGLMVWWDHLLYGQPPPGLDVRLSIDLGLQRIVDDLLGDLPGAAVLINAQSGEILAIASHPGFDPNSMEADFHNLISSPEKPLIDRSNLGVYATPVGLGPLILQDKMSPVQMVTKAAAISAGGMRPEPQLSLAVHTPQSGWVLLPTGDPVADMNPATADAFANSHSIATLPFWQVTATAGNSGDQTVTWFMGGTLPDWQGISLTAVVLLEENDLDSAEQIGQAVLQSAIQP